MIIDPDRGTWPVMGQSYQMEECIFHVWGKDFPHFLLVANKEACTLVATGDHFTTVRAIALEGRRAEKWKESESWMTMLEVAFASGLPVM